MGLISKTVIVKWSGSNRKWYEGKGYIFTKIKDNFEVKVEDLSNGSGTLVEVRCDCINCTTPINKPIQWAFYFSRINKDGKYYCKKCANNLFGKEKMLQTKLANGKSFEQWCIENNRQDVLDRWNYELNNEKPNEITFSSGVGYSFKCPRGIHPSEIKNISKFTSGYDGSINCNHCNSFEQWGIDNICEDFLEKYWDYEKNIVNPWEIDYSSHINIYIKCQEKDYHGSYEVRCNKFVNKQRCYYCNSNSGKVHLLDSLGKILEDRDLLEIWSDKNIKTPYEYAPFSKGKVWWKCIDEKHEDYERIISNSNICNFHCPKCTRERDESFLQERVRLYLESLGYTILHEHGCTIVPINPKTKNNLPFDNEVMELKLIIEVHGGQHYKINKWTKQAARKNNTTSEYELHMQQVRDRYKRIFVKSQGYKYMAIPYWTNDKEETWKQLINDKIKTTYKNKDINY